MLGKDLADALLGVAVGQGDGGGVGLFLDGYIRPVVGQDLLGGLGAKIVGEFLELLILFGAERGHVDACADVENRKLCGSPAGWQL